MLLELVAISGCFSRDDGFKIWLLAIKKQSIKKEQPVIKKSQLFKLAGGGITEVLQTGGGIADSRWHSPCIE
jgi:hypothetical protein